MNSLDLLVRYFGEMFVTKPAPADCDEPCIEPTLSLKPNGYHQYRIGARSWLFHRLAFQLANPAYPLTSDIIVRHRCDNTACCNITHLVAGTHVDNMADKVERGRCRGGRPLGDTADKVIERYTEIANSYVNEGLTEYQLADRHGVTNYTVRRALRTMGVAVDPSRRKEGFRGVDPSGTVREERRQQIVKLYQEEQLTVAQIVEQMKSTQGTVTKTLRAAGITVDPKRRMKKPVETKPEPERSRPDIHTWT
jgi:hypothetical protein